ncbi:bromodomain-containing protein 4-like [Diaphorina citri]|uniref:Bromodomain-containing protein 4-like n=1 Tax=Diaphorina citri TaxID=121845 RepID=A0A1S4EQH6_DIACI|nr:bromodomain-containing protein 4-like [Diaphorina citri]
MSNYHRRTNHHHDHDHNHHPFLLQQLVPLQPPQNHQQPPLLPPPPLQKHPPQPLVPQADGNVNHSHNDRPKPFNTTSCKILKVTLQPPQNHQQPPLLPPPPLQKHPPQPPVPQADGNVNHSHNDRPKPFNTTSCKILKVCHSGKRPLLCMKRPPKPSFGLQDDMILWLKISMPQLPSINNWAFSTLLFVRFAEMVLIMEIARLLHFFR